jgi:YHS domain-containing protein
MGEPVVRTYDGREVRFCCASCIDKFEADLEASLKKLDQLIIARQKADYPLEVCLVSGEKLGEMGEPVDYVHDNQLVRFCCAHCIGTFEKDPGLYLKKLEAARAARKADQPQAEPGEGEKSEGHEGHGEHQGH